MYDHAIFPAKHVPAPAGQTSAGSGLPPPTGALPVGHNATANISWLPAEMQQHVASYLPARSYLSLRATCRAFDASLRPDTSARYAALIGHRFARQYVPGGPMTLLLDNMKTWISEDRVDVLRAFARRGAMLEGADDRGAMVARLASYYRHLSPAEQAQVTVAIVQAYGRGEPAGTDADIDLIVDHLHYYGTSAQSPADHWHAVLAAAQALAPQSRAGVFRYLAGALRREVFMADTSDVRPPLVDDPANGAAARCHRLLDAFEAQPGPVRTSLGAEFLDLVRTVGVAGAEERAALRQRIDGMPA